MQSHLFYQWYLMMSKQIHKKIFAFCLIACGIFLLWQGLLFVGYYAGAVRWKHIPLNSGSSEVPHERTMSWEDSSALTEDILQYWAVQKLPNWQENGKVNAPRILLAKLVLKQDIEAVNTYLLNQHPWGRSGSTWALHPEGDYDFTLAALTGVLYLFGESPYVLFPETRDHLLSTLLIEEGGNPAITVPRTLGLVRDTENHLLMTEGSRYLKNRWLALHGNADPRYNNLKNGLETWLLSFLKELREAGLYEFNSVPYLGYTMTALLNLEAFGSEAIRRSAREILDRLNWEYAVGSFALRRYAPFRRQLRKADITSLNGDYHTALMKVWMSLLVEDPALDLELTGGYHHALWACLFPYRPPDKVVRWVERKPVQYFARIGHGPGASPEIYSGSPDYLISAGGVHRGRRSMIVARPITLMLNDQAKDLKEVLHIAGPGDAFTEWNNTGVYRNFACAAGPVHIPDGWVPAAQNDLWTVYQGNENLFIAVYSRQNLGVFCLFREENPGKILQEVSTANPDPDRLYQEFQWPNAERITYDVKAPKDQWVIRSADGQKLNHDFDRWPLMEAIP